MTQPNMLQDVLPQSLGLWVDPVPRAGYFNMAADELLSGHSRPWLRVYGWALPAVSYGYFDTRAVAERLFPNAHEYIRRWTGGGIVDHRIGITYTLTLPAAENVVYPAAPVLYRLIHGALAAALNAHGVSCRLLTADAPDGGRACWASPVTSDIAAPDGRKLAGAGQRRHKGAVLHQGLVQGCTPTPGWEKTFARLLCPDYTAVTAPEPYIGFEQEVQQLLAEKYLVPAWEDERNGRR